MGRSDDHVAPPEADRRQKVLTAASESALADGEALLSRLERALAHADRMTATSEASLAQHTAVEKHLASLANSAEGLVGGLAGAVQRASQSLDTMQRGVDKLFADAEARFKAFEAQLLRVSEVSNDAEEQTRRVESACEHAGCIESRLTSFAEQLADKAGELQERTAALMTGLEAGDEAQTRLDAILEQASSVTGDAGEKINALRTTLDHTKSEAEQFQKQFTDSAVAGCRQKLQEQLERDERSASEAIQATQNKLDRIVKQASSATTDVDKKIEFLRANLDDTKREAERFQKQFTDSAVAGCRQKLQEQSERYERSAFEAIQAAQDKLDRIIKQASSATADADARLEAVSTSLKHTVSEAEQFREWFTDAAIRSCQEKLREQFAAHQRSQEEAVETTMAEHRARLRATTDEFASQVRAMDDTIAAGREKVAGTLAECEGSHTELLDVLHGRADELRQQVETLEERQKGVQSSIAPLSDRVGRAVAIVGDLNETVEGVESSVDELAARAGAVNKGLSEDVPRGERLVRDVGATCGQIEAIQRNVATTLLDIGGACERVKAVRDQANLCEQVLGRLASGQVEGERTAKQLDDAVASAGQLLEPMQQLVADAAEESGRLRSQNASATDAVRNLSKVNAEGHSIIERVSESTRKAEEAAGTTEERINRLTVVQTAGESSAQQLNELVASAAQLHEAMQGLIAHADEKIGRLDSHNASASDVLGNLSKANAQGDKLIEQAGNSRHALEEAAGNATEQIERLLQDLRALTAKTEVNAKELVACNAKAGELIDNATHQGATLQELNSSAHDLIETYEQIKPEAETATRQLAAHLSATQKSLETGEPLLNQFVAQAQSLEEQLRNLHGKAIEIEQHLNEATAKPAEIVASAQAQAAQLEGVCAAVRKVFGGLSQVSLEARSQTTQFKQSSQEATGRLTQLKAETDRAANTLHEWVEEALRVQSRLEGTLQNCPSIRETHPGDGLLRMSRTVRPAADESPGRGRTARPPAGTEVISQLIEDAKRATAGPGAPV